MVGSDLVAGNSGGVRDGHPVSRLRNASASARRALGRTFEEEMDRGRGALWLPVLFGAGVLVYFGLAAEPSGLLTTIAAMTFIAAAIATRHRPVMFRLLVALAAVAAGLCWMKFRTELVARPIAPAAYTGGLAGWIEELERLGPRETRIVVRVRSLEGLDAEDQPGRVRVSVRGQFDDARVGDGITGLVALQPPAAPVIPGGYDFGRELFYRGIGGSGFSYGPPDRADIGPAPLSIRWRVPIENLRVAIGRRIEAALPGDTGQIANALITGDRGGVSEETTEAYRVSGLTHILSISGLHMALVAGFVFGLVRAILALFPSLALRRPIKKWAAASALAVSTFYLLLSGAEVATQRSFIMLAVLLGAVLLDRRAFSIRNIAIAAAVVLLLTPEAILTAGFQMSFAATLALVAGFEWWAERRQQRLAIGPPPRWSILRWALLGLGGALLTSVLAGLATAPFGAFHFNQTQPLSLFANIVAIPVVSLVVMPAALFAVLLMPFGLDGFPLWLMGRGLDAVTAIADWTTSATGDAGMVAATPAIALILAVVGLLWLCLWRQPWRLAGLLPLTAFVFLAGRAVRPDILIEETGAAAMVRGPDGAYRLMGGGATYEAEVWLRMDADPRIPGDDTLETGVFCDPLGCTAPLADTGLRVALVERPTAFAEDCRVAAVVVTGLVAPADCAALVIDAEDLARYGVHALYAEPGVAGERPAFRIETVRSDMRRPWMPPLPPQ